MAFRDRMLQHINDERAAFGAPPVVMSSSLETVAQGGDFSGCGGFVVHGRATDMGERNYFNHTIKACGNEGIFQMLIAAGIVHSGAGENIAFASPFDDEDAAASVLHQKLVASPVHHNNMVNPAFTHVGIGVFRTGPGDVWTGTPAIPPDVPANQPITRVFVTSHIFAQLPPQPLPGATFHVVSPTRVLDTRPSAGGAGPVAAGATIDVQVTGLGGVPVAGASAVALNLTVTGPTAAGFLVAFPTGDAVPGASNLNFGAGQTVANLVTVELGAGGRVSVLNAGGTAHVIADVAGWFDDGAFVPAGNGAGVARFHPLDQARILDTRFGLGAPAGPVGAGSTTNLQVSGQAGVLIGQSTAAVLSLAVTSPSAAGFLTVFPAGEARPVASNLNFGAGQTVANLVVAKLGAGGQVSIFNASGTTEVIADVAGWFDDGTLPAGARFHPVTAARILDTRSGNGAPAVPLGSAAPLTLQVTGRGGVPASGVTAVVLNLTATAPTAGSFLTTFRPGGPVPSTSNLNFVAGATIANLVVAKLGPDGQVAIANNSGTVHVIADVGGWFDGG